MTCRCDVLAKFVRFTQSLRKNSGGLPAEARSNSSSEVVLSQKAVVEMVDALHLESDHTPTCSGGSPVT